MEQGEIYYNGYDDSYCYKEPFGDNFREVGFYSKCNDPNPNSPLVWQFLRTVLAFVGWKYTRVIYSRTIQDWYVKGKTIPMTPEERECVMQAILKRFKNMATRVKIVDKLL